MQRTERTNRKAELRAMSDTDLQTAYRAASALEAKELRAEIERRENLAETPKAMPDPVSTELRERLANFTPEERERLRTEAQELRTARGETPAGAWRAVIEGAEQDRLTGTGRYAGAARVTPTAAGTGPGRVPLGGTDADRRAARPRMEGESDRAYEVRTAPSRDAALAILNGNQAAGLRSIARRENVPTSGSKADLVARLIRVMRDRHEDSQAIERMVNRDRQQTTTPPQAPRGVRQGLADMPLATQRLGGREPLVDTVARIQQRVRSGEITRTEAANLLSQLVQRFSVSQGDPEKDAISAELARLAAELRATAPQPTLTGSQLLAQRRRAAGR